MAQGRNRIHLAASVLLLACFVGQLVAMPMHPDLLSFVKLPTASSSLSEELEQTAARTLQQADTFPQPSGSLSLLLHMKYIKKHNRRLSGSWVAVRCTHNICQGSSVGLCTDQQHCPTLQVPSPLTASALASEACSLPVASSTVSAGTSTTSFSGIS